MFEELSKEPFSKREETILDFWENNKIFEKSLEARKDAPLFSFYDGPPFATGLPHYGHLLAGTIKDVIPRYKTMKGFYVPRRFGWDCHGLPIESEIEKANGLSGSISIEEFGIANFNEECRRVVLRYTQEWKKTVQRMGRWVNIDEAYKTMDLSFMETVWWVFKQLYDKGLVYQGFKVMPFSAKLGTALSNFEAGENYKDIDDPSIVVSFPLEDEPETSLLVWTTTPWTLISNLAITVGEDITYVKVKSHADQRQYILAKNCLSHWFVNPEEEILILDEFWGHELVAKKYHPLFAYFESRAQQGAFRVISGDFVTLDEGTGLVHTAPAFGEDDFIVCQRAGIDLVCPVDNNGFFTSDIPEYEGIFVKDADKKIIRSIKESNRLFQQGTVRHRYPFCYRTDTPLIYKAVKTWFIAVEKIKDKLVQSNESIHWTPSYLKEGRFGKWLAGARDWNFSRHRYWGTPIPIWESEDGDLEILGSLDEVQKKTGKRPKDLHRHFIDDLTFEKEGKTYRRIPEVFDCWFESGSMPYSQFHYPFENVDEAEKAFPAQFIAEGLDQTRGWFYTLTVLSTALFEKTAFNNVIVNGIILTEDGSKMSKRLKNYPEPERVIGKYGADAIRLYLLHSPAVRGDDLKFSERGVELVMRQILIPLWNAFDGFFVTYARIYDWKPQKDSKEVPNSVIDRWILSLLQKLILNVEKGLDAYDLSLAVEPFVGFIDDLTNWYIRRCRRRFYTDDDTPDRREAFETLYTVLLKLTQIAAPFIPMLSEAMYRNLRSASMPESVHLCDYPAYNAFLRDAALEQQMQALRTVVSLGHSLRKDQGIKVRQPLKNLDVACVQKSVLDFLKSQSYLICQELNIKEIGFSQDDSAFVKISAKPNFPILGKKVGSLMRRVQEKIQHLSHQQLLELFQGNSIEIDLADQHLTLCPEDVQMRREVIDGVTAANEGDMTIALNTSLDDALIKEGLSRELTNRIQKMRRDCDFAVTDRIHVEIETSDVVKEAYLSHKDWVKSEILALSVTFTQCPQGTHWDLNGHNALISLKKA